MKKKRWVGVLGGSGFLLLIKGLSGLLANIWNRPSSSWRTEISMADVLVYVLVVGALYTLVHMIANSDVLNRKRLVLIVAFLSVLMALLIGFPLFDFVLFSIHPMILVITGALLLPAMGNLSFHA